jgi:hypothetical protein
MNEAEYKARMERLVAEARAAPKRNYLQLYSAAMEIWAEFRGEYHLDNAFGALRGMMEEEYKLPSVEGIVHGSRKNA